MKIRAKGIRKAHADKIQAVIEKELESNRIYENEYSIDISFIVSPYMIVSDLSEMLSEIDEAWETSPAYRSTTRIEFGIWLQSNMEEDELEPIIEKIKNHILTLGDGTYEEVQVAIGNEGRTLIEDNNKETDSPTSSYTRINTRGKHVRRTELPDSGQPEGCDGHGVSDPKGGHTGKKSAVHGVYKINGEWIVMPKGMSS